MALKLTIVKSPEGDSPDVLCTTFDESGGSIGRGQDNSWVLPDPDRFLSVRHSEISCENGRYFLTDYSTNGTFVNDAAEPLGKGGRVPLQNGDTIELGDYQLTVSLTASDEVFESILSTPVQADSPFADPFADVAVSTSAFDQKNDNYHQHEHQQPIFEPTPGEKDPLAALNGSAFDKQVAIKSSGAIFEPQEGQLQSYSDSANAVNQSIDWPSAVLENAVIPEDWDSDVAEPIQSETKQPEIKQPEAQQTQVQQPEATLVEREKKPATVTVSTPQEPVVDKSKDNNKPGLSPTLNMATVLIEAMGLEKNNLDEQQTRELCQTAGEFIRQAVDGLMLVLRSRTNIKNEFRMNITTIQPLENNPLKFSANVDDALEKLFIKSSKAYKPPLEAVNDSFQGIAEHEIALLAGMQSGFNRMIERFDPQKLEKQFEKHNKKSVIPSMQKAKCWESYKGYYDSLVDNMESSFQHLFGDEFVQAYEDQLRKLEASNKKNSN